MTDIYNMTAKLFIGGVEVGRQTVRCLYEIPPANETIDVNWDNILETFRDYDFLVHSFAFNDTRRGRKIELFQYNITLKEWVAPTLEGCKIMITYSKGHDSLTLQELLETDCAKAIQYIKERLH